MSAGAAHASVPRRIARVLPYLGVVVSVLVLAAPSLMDFWEAQRASAHISTMSSTVDALPAETRQRLLEQAHAYNVWLAGGDGAGVGLEAGTNVAPDSGMQRAELLPYEEQLRSGTTTMMSWLDIPSIDVRLPIYHGTEEPALAAGVGHLRTSSLPVGGPSTHCVLTAHSGVAGSRMFDDIRLLEPGDKFVLWTLGEPYAYEVEGNEVVLPSEAESLFVERGQDRCTLITCTPYGVNSHRLLVHARRCEYEPRRVADAPAHVSSRLAPVLVAFGAIAAVVLFGVALRFWRAARFRRT